MPEKIEFKYLSEEEVARLLPKQVAEYARAMGYDEETIQKVVDAAIISGKAKQP